MIYPDSFLNKIICGDCIKIMNFMPNNVIDLVVTSPPYDMLRTYKGYNFDFEKIAEELYRVIMPGGVLAWIVGDATKQGSETGSSFRQTLYFKSIGFRLHDTMIYAKSSYVPLNHNRYEQQFEYMFILSKGRPKIFNPILVSCKNAGRNPHRTFYQHADDNEVSEAHKIMPVKNTKIAPNIFWYAPVQGRGGKGHPAMFPVQLAADHIYTWTKKGAIVLDPMIGSGTTALAALRLNRSFIGIDIAVDYCKLAENRIQKVREA